MNVISRLIRDMKDSKQRPRKRQAPVDAEKKAYNEGKKEPNPVEEILHIVLLFFIYSFLGWCMEVILKYIQFHRFINRGFYAGPICPIYGSGALLITLAFHFLPPPESGIGTTFALSLVLCGALEYFTSYFMEKRFHTRWWDYSRKPMNLHGRIWIGNLLLFGLGGVMIIHVLNPVFLSWLAGFSLRAKAIAAGIILAVFAADFVLTHFIMKLVKTGVENSRADSTEELNREIRMLLSNRNVFYRRFADAYPDVIYRTERIKSHLEAVRKKADLMLQEAEQVIEDQKKQVIRRVEPSTMIRNGIIDKQGRLIDMLYDEASATEETRSLKKEIDNERHRLDERPLSKIVRGNE